ncbi:MAG: SecD/SecF family protein translocase subunit [Angelakisella sp.]
MKRAKKWPFFVMAALILIASYLVLFGVSFQNGDVTNVYVKGADSIRWGIDIRGGVDATFSPANGYNATPDEMNSAQSIIEIRLVNLGITDYEVYTDQNNDRIIVRFPWKVGESDFNPELAVKELGDTALLTFREGMDADANGNPTGKVILEGKDLIKAELSFAPNALGVNSPVVSFKLTPGGATKFAEATAANIGKIISIWMDETLISYPKVNGVISEGEGIIEGGFTVETAQALASKINGGALPFKLVTENYSSISPTLGLGAKDAMIIAGTIAFILVCIYMVIAYRLPGFVAVFALIGQVIFMIGAVTKIFPAYSSFTLTLPGIAGIILGIGMGVDANIISAERIKEEIRTGKTIDGSVSLGFERAFSAILDGNVTVIIVAVILMGAFGPPDSIFVKLLQPLFFIFGKATAGSIYSFGYTLLMGVLANMVMGVWVSRQMLRSVSQLKCCRKPWLYGGAK